jgi:AraC-like DNA-binding protein
MTSTLAMDVSDPSQREGRRVDENRQELIERIGRAVPQDGTVEPLPGLHLTRMSSATEPVHGVSIPSFCVIAQGSKNVYLGEDYYRYDSGHYLIATTELPIVFQIAAASNDRPHLSLRLDLSPSIVGPVMVDAALPAPRRLSNAKAIDVSPLDGSLLDAVIRLVKLLDEPIDARVLMPLITREIVYRLLSGAQADRLRQMARLGGATDRVVTAIERLRRDYDKPLRIENLAREMGMSVSGFHAQFKAVTAMSPLQFQKQVRLQEARRLMFGEDLDATTAGHCVGYDDASYFNREYKSLFGAPPIRDVQRLRAAATSSADL